MSRSPTGVFVALGALAVLSQALWDCPLRCPAVLMTLFGLAGEKPDTCRFAAFRKVTVL